MIWFKAPLDRVNCRGRSGSGPWGGACAADAVAHAQSACRHSITSVHTAIVSLRSTTYSDKSFFIHRVMAEDEAGGSGTAAETPSAGNLKSLIKESIRELFHEDPTLLSSGDHRRDSDRTTEEGESALDIRSW